MNKETYIRKSQEIFKKYEEVVLSRQVTSLNYGASGLLLYYTQKYLDTKDFVILVKVKNIVKYILKKMEGEFDETSFFLSPLGCIWSILIVEKQLNLKLVEDEFVNVFLKEYFNNQKKILTGTYGILDYIYGTGAWFVIFPYLNLEMKKFLFDIFEHQLIGFDLATIGKVDYSMKKLNFSYSHGNLGFSHGLSSILSILKEYDRLKKYNKILNDGLILIKEEIDERNMTLPRFKGSNDIVRQDWCHGILGFLLLATEDEKIRILNSYLNRSIAPNDHGICHGLGQNILVKKIFSSDQDESLILPEMSFDVDFENINFIQSPLVAEMSIRFNFSRDQHFSWWRMVYPINYE